VSGTFFAAPAPGSQGSGGYGGTAGQAHNAELKSGNYNMSGSRKNIYISFSGRHGRGNYRDESGSFSGDFRAEISGDMLSLSFTSGKDSGITFDYKITSETSFMRFGEMRVRRY
jgi:hypothetical protein